MHLHIPRGTMTSASPAAFSISEFCSAHRISRSTFYRLLKAGDAPALTHVRSRVLISAEAAAAWRLAHSEPVAA
jgi:hypothetical protein